jgi:mercuric ion transport protein
MTTPGVLRHKEKLMNDKTMLRRGLIGGVIAAICCFTPLLGVVVVGVGLSALVGWLDYALFPLLFTSLGVVAHALWLQAGKPGRCPKNLIVALVVLLSAGLIWFEFLFALRISVAAALAVAAYAIWLKRRAPRAPVAADADRIS